MNKSKVYSLIHFHKLNTSVLSASTLRKRTVNANRSSTSLVLIPKDNRTRQISCIWLDLYGNWWHSTIYFCIQHRCSVCLWDSSILLWAEVVHPFSQWWIQTLEYHPAIDLSILLFTGISVVSRFWIFLGVEPAWL